MVDIAIFDNSGAERDWEWLAATYGLALGHIHQPEEKPGYFITQLRERTDTAANLDVWVWPKEGNGGIPVAFWWPDVEITACEDYEPKLFCYSELTSEEDNGVGFAFGPGAKYDPTLGPGPHAVWVRVPNSAWVEGLGMVAGTNHDHLEVTFAWLTDEVVEPVDVIMPLAERELEALPVPEDWALPATAIAAGFRYQVGGYGRTFIGNDIWVYQTFTNEDQSKYVVAFCQDHDWANVQIAEVIRD